VNIILASASPRRCEILQEHGIVPVVTPSAVDETLPPDIASKKIEEIVMYLAHIKARAVYQQVDKTDAIILAADTVIYKDGVGIIGKPTNTQDAFKILSTLKNTAHDVLTGVSLIDAATGQEQQFYDVTHVHFKDYSDSEIYRYIKEEPPFDKSGSYGIQTSWQVNVDYIEGDIENVMGLPWHRLEHYLDHYLEHHLEHHRDH
jgi:septum formation protein